MTTLLRLIFLLEMDFYNANDMGPPSTQVCGSVLPNRGNDEFVFIQGASAVVFESPWSLPGAFGKNALIRASTRWRRSSALTYPTTCLLSRAPASLPPSRTSCSMMGGVKTNGIFHVAHPEPLSVYVLR
jgi:hypothetical protein